jgi:hypothetical protein
LHRNAVPLDSKLHRNLKLTGAVDYAGASTMHMVYVSSTEMLTAALDFVIVFVEMGPAPAGGKAPLLPVALLGTQREENLYVEDGHWTARYIPSFFRRHPFATAPREGLGDAPAVLVDPASPRLTEGGEGVALFDAEGKPTPALNDILSFLNGFDREVDMTRRFCAVIQHHDLLKPMTAKMTMPDGEELSVSGFFMFDEEKARALPAAVKVELLDNGTLTGLQTHQVSLGNLRYLTERRARRAGKSVATVPV